MTKKRMKNEKNLEKKVRRLLKSVSRRLKSDPSAHITIVAPEIREVNFPDVRKEAWFSEGEGKVWINNATASFKKAERWGIKAKRYHVIRCSFDAILEWAVENRKINPMESFEIRDELFRKWGETK